MDASHADIEFAVSDMPFPAQRWQIYAWAEHNGARRSALEVLLALPDRSYASLIDICSALETLQTAPMEICRHRRHPRLCPWRDAPAWTEAKAS